MGHLFLSRDPYELPDYGRKNVRGVFMIRGKVYRIVDGDMAHQ